MHVLTCLIHQLLPVFINSKIMSLSNKLVYEGRLECASERVSTATVHLPQLRSLKLELEFKATPQSAWIKDVLEPTNPVFFLNTEEVGFIHCSPVL